MATTPTPTPAAAERPLASLDRQELERRLNTARLWWSRAASLIEDGPCAPPPMRYSDEPPLIDAIRKLVARNKELTAAIRRHLDEAAGITVKPSRALDLSLAELRRHVT